MLQRISAVLFSVATGCGGLIAAHAARADDVVWYKPMPGIVPALALNVGLYRGTDFHLTTGACRDCAAPRQALWYFRDDVVAAPTAGVPVAGFTRGLEAQDDVQRWLASATERDLQARPPLLWVGATHVARHLTLTEDDTLLFGDGRSVQFSIVPKIQTNLSYFDGSSKAFLRKRALRMRGELRGNIFTARGIWPQDWAIDEKQMHPAPLLADESLQSVVRRHVSAKNETFEARLLWERAPPATPAARDWSGRAVIAFMLNGAQGDDDEAHGGHFAVLTGRQAKGGEWADWMVNNFYNLDTFSEKGITAAMLPADNYLTDLNSGQSWYRPSYMLVAVLKNDRAAYAFQAAIARVYQHYYRHDFQFHHATANCAGISMDTLRSLGWPIPALGPTSAVQAVAAYPYKSIAERSFAAGKASFDYLMAEQSRLYPAAAWDAVGRELLRITGSAAQTAANANPKALEPMLREDIDALVFVRIPQLPSSRAFGSFPVATYDEYMARVPHDKSQWKIVPVDARPFPAGMMEPDILKPAPTPPWAPAAVAAGVLALGAALVWRVRRKRVAQQAK